MKKLRASGTAAAFCLTSTLIVNLTGALAQPQPQAPAPAPAQPAAQAKDVMEATAAQMKKMMAMTPAQMQQELLRLQEVQMRDSFKRAGFNDLELQDTFWQWLMEQEKARVAVRGAARKVLMGMAPVAGGGLTDAQMEAAIADYQSMAEDERARREIAIDELDKKIDFSHKPKLRALLMLQGYVGDEAWFTTTSMMASSMSISSVVMVGNK